MLSLVYTTIKVIISVVFISSSGSYMKRFDNISLVKALPRKCAQKLLLYTPSLSSKNTFNIRFFLGIRNVDSLRVFSTSYIHYNWFRIQHNTQWLWLTAKKTNHNNSEMYAGRRWSRGLPADSAGEGERASGATSAEPSVFCPHFSVLIHASPLKFPQSLSSLAWDRGLNFWLSHLQLGHKVRSINKTDL